MLEKKFITIKEYDAMKLPLKIKNMIVKLLKLLGDNVE